MGCFFAMFAAFFPRLATLFIWLARPGYFNAAFGGSWFWPLLGILFLPFTTLMYVLLWSGAGIVGWDWLWLGLAVVLDITHYVGSAYGGRDRIPGYSSRATI
jgi:hypothetical protein